MAHAYTLKLTAQDMEFARFVGDRYSWSAALIRLCEEGENKISESDAWSLAEAFAEDAEGGHQPFPLLSDRSDLYSKLLDFWSVIV